MKSLSSSPGFLKNPLGFLWRSYKRQEWRTPRLLLALLSAVSFLSLNAFIFEYENFYKLLTPAAATPTSSILENIRQGFLSSWHMLNFYDWPASAWVHMAAGSVPFAIFALSALAIYRLRFSLFDLHIRQRTKGKSKPRRIVIMFLSLPFRVDLKNDFLMEIASFSTKDLKESCQCQSRFNWQQNLRILSHHLQQDLPEATGFFAWFKKVVLKKPAIIPKRQFIILPSPQAIDDRPNGDANWAELFKQMAEQVMANSLIENRPEIMIAEPVDYSKLDMLDVALKKIIQDPELDVHPWEVSIDITAGSKLPTIAAAAITFGSPMEFTYVDFNRDNNKHEILPFDITAGFREM